MKYSFVVLTLSWALVAPSQSPNIFDALRKRELVDLLLEKGARTPTEEDRWKTGVSLAASQGLTNLFRLLTEREQGLRGAVPSDKSLLHTPSAGGSAEIVGMLLDEGFPAAQPDRFAWTPLHYAARDGESHAYWARADVIEKARPKPSQESLSKPQEIQAIEQSIRDCIGWAKTKDFERLYSVIANDPDFLEVHPDGKVVKGFDEFRRAEPIWKSPDFKAVRYEIRDLRIKLSRSREVAWFYCILDDINEWKGQPANWENTRWTGVLEKRDGRWVMVQQHFSK